MTALVVTLTVLGSLAAGLALFLGLAKLRSWRIGRLSWPFNGEAGGCYRCRTGWRFVSWHVTPYEPGRGLRPLCERCWSELTPEGRYRYYARFLADWMDALERAGDEKEVARIRASATSVVAALRAGL